MHFDAPLSRFCASRLLASRASRLSAVGALTATLVLSTSADAAPTSLPPSASTTTASVNPTAMLPETQVRAALPVNRTPVRGPIFEDAIRSALRSPAWSQVDPTLEVAEKLNFRALRLGRKVIVRMTPVVDGVKVVGADRILTYVDGQPQSARAQRRLHRLNRFEIAPELAVATAASTVRGSLFIDPTVERLGGFTVKTWMAQADGIRAAYRVRVPTLDLRDLSDVWVDASTGKVLLRQPVARFGVLDGGVDDDGGLADGGLADSGLADSGLADSGLADSGLADSGVIDDAGLTDAGDDDAGPTDAGIEDAGVNDAGPGEPDPEAPTTAIAYVYSPAPDDLTANLNTVDLEGLLPSQVGGYLRGKWVATFNCCKAYVCIDGSDECLLPAEQRCATDDDEDVINSELALELPASLLPLPIEGDTIFARTVFCAELPRVVSRAADGTDPAGWYETPVDSSREENQLRGLASEEDAFSEVQAYYATMTFFAHLRDVFEDQTWCLGGLSMACDADGSPTIDAETGDPLRAFHVATNVLIPNIDITDLAGQLFAGRGTSAGNPLVVDDYMRLDNAVFLPALEGGIEGIPPEFGAIADAFNRPYDSNLYFQGSNDFAYDSSIVFHEFTHAVVHSVAPNLISQFRDQWGSHVEPGAMNEGWADFFSSSFRDDPVMGQYGASGIVGGETGLRNAANTKKCPDDITGEVHDDSEPWTGALWDIREAVLAADGQAGVMRYDRALLTAMALSDVEENFAAQAARVMAEVESEFGAAMSTTAEAAFTDHGILSCERVWNLATLDGDDVVVNIKPALFMVGPGDVGLSNFAPAVLQLRVEVPAGSTGFSLRWTESNGGAASQFTGGGDPPVLLVLVHEGEAPIEWRYEDGGQVATPYDSATGERIPFDITAAENAIVLAGNAASFDVVLESDPCESRTFIAHILDPVEATTLSNIDLVAFDSEGTCDGVEPEADGGTATPDPTTPPPDCGCDTSSGGTGGDADAGGPLFALVALIGLAFGIRRRRA